MLGGVLCSPLLFFPHFTVTELICASLGIGVGTGLGIAALQCMLIRSARKG